MRAILRILGGLVVASVAFAAPAAVVDSAAHGFTVSNTVTVPAGPDQVWRALVRDVDRWWPKDHSWFGDEGRFRIETRAGGCFCEKSGRREVRHLEVSHVDPGRMLRLLGALGPMQGMGLNGVMDFTLEPLDDDQTRITLRHRVGGYATEDLVAFAPVVDRVQAQQLAALADYIREP